MALSFNEERAKSAAQIMKQPEFLDIDPRLLHLPTTRPNGADPVKLQRQIIQYGSSQDILPILVYRGSDGAYIIFDGVTRATRLAKLRPGISVRIEVIGYLAFPCKHLPTVGERLP